MRLGRVFCVDRVSLSCTKRSSEMLMGGIHESPASLVAWVGSPLVSGSSVEPNRSETIFLLEAALGGRLIVLCRIKDPDATICVQDMTYTLINFYRMIDAHT